MPSPSRIVHGLAHLSFCLVLLAGLLPALTPALAHAGPLPRDQVPPPLQGWVPWVLHDVPEAGCPHLYSTADQPRCAWPEVLSLNLNRHGGSFSQEWRIYRKAWIALPGEHDYWPQRVTLNGKPVQVVDRDGIPSIHVEPGSYRLQGEFNWELAPETLAIPSRSGIVLLTLNGAAVPIPQIEEGRVWLQARGDGEAAEDSVDLKIFRKIVDGVPVQVETRFVLAIAGKNRELTLQGGLLKGFLPLELKSSLPAQAGLDGKIRLQARPGRWEVTLIGRATGPAEELAAPNLGDAGPPEEVWSFAANSAYRVASLEGPPQVEPQQSSVPDEWKSYPAYLVKPQTPLKIVTRQRGDDHPAPDQLKVQRDLWLHFDGSGLTVKDQITGTLNRSYRLSISPGTQLGRVALNQRDQVITQVNGPDGKPRLGVEVREGAVNLTADSVLSRDGGSLPAVGWQFDADRLAATLHLPAGWQLIYAGGTDRGSGAWLTEWNLLDFFLVLVIALAFGKLFGWTWGAVAMLAMVLAYREPQAPRYLWIGALALAALAQVLPEGRFRTVAVWGRRGWLVVLVLVCIAFAVGQVRSALYPVLERTARIAPVARDAHVQRLGQRAEDAPAPAAEAPQVEPMAPPAPPPPGQDGIAYSVPAPSGGKTARSLAKKSAESSIALDDARPSKSMYRAQQTVDPNAQVQTGPGLPDWQWRSYRLTWNGPVQAGETLRLWLTSPTENRLVTVLRLALLAALLYRLLAGAGTAPAGGGGIGWLRRFRRPGAVAAAILAGLMAWAAPAPEAQAAELPNAELLEKLREKLTQPHDCLPNCAEIPRAHVLAADDTVRLTLEVHSAIDVAVPLPGAEKRWLARELSIDGKPATVVRENDHLLALIPAGVHQIVVQGSLAGRNDLNLALPLKPRRVTTETRGWTVVGIGDNGVPSDALQLSRVVRAAAGQGKEAASELPPFVQIERRLQLGLQWQVETRVLRHSPIGTPIVLAVPLLPGEAVTTGGLRVENGKALVNLPPQSTEFSWTSALPMTKSLALAMPKDVPWSERWILDASPIWHVDWTGLPPLAAHTPASREPTWAPFPGETLNLAITRPTAVPGQTVTIDRSALQAKPGKRATDYTLDLFLRASRGSQQVLTLPEGATLTEVQINSQVQPIRQEGRQVRLPVAPGKQMIKLSWRQDAGIGALWRSESVDLELPGVNATITAQLPEDRWILFAGGPAYAWGPAILFWGVLLVLLAVALGLDQLNRRAVAEGPLTPLTTLQWVLLAVGLTQVSIVMAAVLVAWLLALGWRARQVAAPRWLFNLRQAGLALLTLVSLGILIAIVQQGLLGRPDMQIAGNNSWGSNLHWYLDRNPAQLPTAWVISVPMLVYRLLMLAWALWLAYTLLKWLRWGWGAWSEGGYWIGRPWRRPKEETPAATDEPAAPKVLPPLARNDETP